MSKSWGRAAILAASLFGGSSLLMFGVFLLLGPFNLIDLNLSTGGVLSLDFALCLMFFVQHSGMVRTSFQRKLGAFVPEHFHGVIYTIASAATLWTVLLLWQPAEPTLASADGPLRWLLRGTFFAATLGFVWGTRSLESLDGFGIQPIQTAMHGKAIDAIPLTIRGPYRWVRHPLYAFVLVLLWSFPDVTTDRLLLNLSWTVWIFVGTILEERDLVNEFGESYRSYQRQVPMLLPLRRKRTAPTR
jgi:protein-S-isoprenylcysteine O-methyltransferase Ste14